MQKAIDWAKKNWHFITLVLSLLAGLSSGYVKVTTDPKATQPSVVIVVPDAPSDNGLVLGTAPVKGKWEIFKARIKAADGLAKKEGVSFEKAWTAVKKVSTEDIVAAAMKAGFPAEKFGDGTLLAELVNWIMDPANQQKIMQFIEFIMSMAKLFLI